MRILIKNILKIRLNHMTTAAPVTKTLTRTTSSRFHRSWTPQRPRTCTQVVTDTSWILMDPTLSPRISWTNSPSTCTKTAWRPSKAWLPRRWSRLRPVSSTSDKSTWARKLPWGATPTNLMRKLLKSATSLQRWRRTKHGLMMFTTMVLFNADITYVFYKIEMLF